MHWSLPQQSITWELVFLKGQSDGSLGYSEWPGEQVRDCPFIALYRVTPEERAQEKGVKRFLSHTSGLWPLCSGAKLASTEARKHWNDFCFVGCAVAVVLENKGKIKHSAAVLQCVIGEASELHLGGFHAVSLILTPNVRKEFVLRFKAFP